MIRYFHYLIITRITLLIYFVVEVQYIARVVGDGCGGGGGLLYNAKNRRNQQYQVYESDFKIPCFTKEEVEKEIGEIQKRIDEQQAKIDTWKEVMNYMQETGVDKYDEVEFKSYRVLKTINQNTSDVEKAKLIAKIINGTF